MRRRLIAISLACLVSLALPGAATAQDDEVFVDPDSPTGREYDIPLERARRDATSKPDPEAASRSRDAPLFGEGIEPPDETGAAPAAGGGDGKKKQQSSSSSRKRPAKSEKRREPLPSTVEAAIQQPGAPGGDGWPLVLVGVAAAGLVGVGVAAGALIRRRR